MRFTRKSKVGNVIPTASMADISFLLLVFFMVSTVFVRYRGIPVTLPQAEKIEKLESRRKVTAIWIDEKGTINIDDQIDVLIDGRRLASAGYREEIGPLDISPFLTRGEHTVTALLFNRKWTAAYGIRLTGDDAEMWHEQCGDVRKIHSGCQEIGNRLGMVKKLSFSFVAR